MQCFYIGTGSHHLLQLNTLSKAQRAKSYTQKVLLSRLEKQGWLCPYTKEKKKSQTKKKERKDYAMHW